MFYLARIIELGRFLSTVKLQVPTIHPFGKYCVHHKQFFHFIFYIYQQFEINLRHVDKKTKWGNWSYIYLPIWTEPFAQEVFPKHSSFED